MVSRIGQNINEYVLIEVLTPYKGRKTQPNYKSPVGVGFLCFRALSPDPTAGEYRLWSRPKGHESALTTVKSLTQKGLKSGVSGLFGPLAEPSSALNSS